jgi:lysophospholipase L1-like esterase
MNTRLPLALTGAALGLSLWVHPAKPAQAVKEAKKISAELENPCIDGSESACRTHAMDAFYAALKKAEAKDPGGVVRVSHFGDSIIAADYVSATVRQRLQSLYGDAGRGFVFPARPSSFHATEGVSLGSGSGWSIDKLPEPRSKDGALGFGASFTAKGKAKAKLSTKSAVSRFEVYYLESPSGGDLSLSLDGATPETISTKGSATKLAWKSLSTTDGPHDLALEAASGVKLYGVTLERDTPGVVYDTIGLVSGAAAHLLLIEESHFKSQLSHRAPNLVIVEFGTNEANYTGTSSTAIAEFQSQQEKVLGQIRKSAPKASCLVVSPVDAAERVADETGEETLRSKAVLPKLVEAQRAAALAKGCAFLDMFTAAGGKGSASSLVSKGYLGRDLAHPTPAGARVIGRAIADAIVTEYGAYKK